MFTWINHNSLYILIFIFPFVISTFTYFYISKNRLFILLLFISLTTFFILVRLIFAPQEPSQQEKIELSSIEQKGKIVVQFFSPNCLGCVLSERAINNFKNTYSEEFKVIQINIADDDYSDMVKKYNVSVVPTFIYFDDGIVVESYKGTLRSSEDLYKKFTIQ
tara:strand:+ start:1199 stop:1687 length:489 start_codon:yes stop_codon:yes gene_type:complete